MKYIAISKIKSIGIRKNVRVLILKTGQIIPTSETKVVTEIGVCISELRNRGRLSSLKGTSLVIDTDDIIITYDGGNISRRSIPAGTELIRTIPGKPEYAGEFAIRLPSFHTEILKITGWKHLV